MVTQSKREARKRQKEIEDLIHCYMNIWTDVRFSIGSMLPTDVLVNRYLFGIVCRPEYYTNNEKHKWALGSRMDNFAAQLQEDTREQPANDPLNGLTDPHGALDTETSFARMRIELPHWANRTGPRSKRRGDHTKFLDDSIQAVMRDLVDDHALGRPISSILHRLADELQHYADNVPSLWQPNDPNARRIMCRLLYLATHMVYVQNAFGSTSAANAIGYPVICAFIKRGLFAAKKAGDSTADTELLAECMAVLYDGPDAAICNAIWDEYILDGPDGVINKHRSPKLNAPVNKDGKWSASICGKYTHFIVTLLQAYMGMIRNYVSMFEKSHETTTPPSFKSRPTFSPTLVPSRRPASTIASASQQQRE